MNRAAMEAAIAAFLDAVGADRTHPDLRDTPRRVAEAWADELLAGHEADPAALLGETAAAPSDAPVVLTGITFVGVCPHHLLPYEGTAHLAYRPGDRIAGFGNLVRLVEVLGARLVLQEDLARDVADALVAHLGARGAGCLIEASHGCVGFRGVRQPAVRTTTSAWAGSFAENDDAGRRALEGALARRHLPPADADQNESR
jgi:GTP cyclohydrolase IA